MKRNALNLVFLALILFLGEQSQSIDRIEIIRFCKRARHYTMCVREFDKIRGASNDNKYSGKTKQGGPIEIEVIPYKYH